jgi:hypothetical protein
MEKCCLAKKVSVKEGKKLPGIWKEAAWKSSFLKKMSGKEVVWNISAGYRPLPDFWPLALSDHAQTT